MHCIIIKECIKIHVAIFNFIHLKIDIATFISIIYYYLTVIYQH